MIAIFKTNVKDSHLADKVLKGLYCSLPGCLFNFDLDDCDRILRVQGEHFGFEIERIIQVVRSQSVQISLFDHQSLFED